MIVRRNFLLFSTCPIEIYPFDKFSFSIHIYKHTPTLFPKMLVKKVNKIKELKKGINLEVHGLEREHVKSVNFTG